LHPEDEQVRRLLRTRVIRLNEWVTGISIGLIAGIILFLATNYLILKGGPVVGPHLALLGQVFIGYRVSFIGSLIGFVYALLSGTIVGYCGAKLYNGIAAINQRKSAKRD
jgi:Mg/Co/Ni transporter MgtE